MATNSANASQNLNASCIGVKRGLFELGCLGPSLAIILILTFLKRRESYKLSSCNGYPGLVIPINFLRSSKSNRFAIAATFGATASTCLVIFVNPNLDNFFPEDSHPWVKVIQGLVSVLVYGIVFYPFFACLTTTYKLIGSLMGFVYAAIRFAFELVFIFQCGSYYDENKRKDMYLRVLPLLPILCCLLFILLRFAVLLGVQVRKHWISNSSCGTCVRDLISTQLQKVPVSDSDADILLNGNTEIEHVSRLLNLDRNKTASDVKGFRKLLYCIYQPRPDFKFSTQFVSTLIVAGIILFQIAIAYVAYACFIRPDQIKGVLSKCVSEPDPKRCENSLNTILGFVDGAWILCLLISVILLLHFMKCHRDHVLQLYRGERRFFQDVSVSPVMLVGRSLRFSGYQIAHTLIGFLCLLTPIVVIALIAGVITAFPYNPYVQILLEGLKQLALNFLPTVVFAVVMWLFQLFLSFFVFSDRDFSITTITVDNRQLFSIASYFFFFYNIILGFIAGFIRILKGLLLGIIFMARIDRACLMQGYQTWDKAFVAYLGFLNVLVAHSHPVMLVFCHLLINRDSDLWLEESLPRTESSGTLQEESYGEGIVRLRRVTRFSQKAANRWLLAVMLLRNPSLLRYRRQGSVTRFVDMRSKRINSPVGIRV
ncbi:PREDICTED: stimulated by retinoic acid gene 6 protein homolog isoform X2 [Acropora digitifera]|uniref:stimulated by retinoic acid gene 6 protein homolog isoform X2 n=1 Tax=Acropora digitifera TaxID=70779 RepID=UPI00077AEDC7|nr:PREDICTED: stimulated by retinoic acid gene 6 protein homolog isoform X2 [Acropora digitifera]